MGRTNIAIVQRKPIGCRDSVVEQLTVRLVYGWVGVHLYLNLLCLGNNAKVLFKNQSIIVYTDCQGGLHLFGILFTGGISLLSDLKFKPVGYTCTYLAYVCL